MVNEMLNCTAEGYEKSLRGYTKAHITPIMLNLVEALVRMGGVSLWASALRRQSKEAVTDPGDVQEYVHKRVNFINYEQRQAEMALSAELTQLQCNCATLVDDNKHLVARCEERQKEAEDARARTLLADEACQDALSAKMKAEAARQSAEEALKHSKEQRQAVVDAAVASAVSELKAEKEGLQQKVAKLTDDAMKAFEEGERVSDEQWEEAYAWAHGEEPQVSLSLMQRYVQYLKRKSNCAIAGMDPPSPFNADAEEEDDEEEEEADEEEVGEGADGEDDEDEEVDDE